MKKYRYISFQIDEEINQELDVTVEQFFKENSYYQSYSKQHGDVIEKIVNSQNGKSLPQMNMKNLIEQFQFYHNGFPLEICEFLERYINFQKSHLLINVSLAQLEEVSAYEKYFPNIINLQIQENELQKVDIGDLRKRYNIELVNGFSIEEFKLRRENYLNALREAESYLCEQGFQDLNDENESFASQFEKAYGFHVKKGMFHSFFDDSYSFDLNPFTIHQFVRSTLKGEATSLPASDSERDYEWFHFHNFIDFNRQEMELLGSTKLIEDSSGVIKVLVSSIPEEQLREVLEVCKKKEGIILKLFPKDVNRLLENNISLSRADYTVEYSCNNVGQAPLPMIEQLGIQSLVIGASENSQVQLMDREEYEEIYQRLCEITKDIPVNASEKRKFKTVYTRLAHYLTYDYQFAEIEKNTKEEEKIEDTYSPRNLKNAVLLGKCVCTGFAETLKQALSLVGIDAIVCDSELADNGDIHTYNQVKIDGIWYNTDLTWDAEAIKKGKKPRYCLKSDEDFVPNKKEDRVFHTPIREKGIHSCPKSLGIYRKYQFQQIMKMIQEKLKKNHPIYLPSEQEIVSGTRERFREQYTVKIREDLLRRETPDMQERRKEMEK